MSTEKAVRMLRAYEQIGPVIMFLSGFFRSPPENFYNGEKVEIDIMRSDEDIAIVMTDLSTGYRMNAADVFTNKEFPPPIFKEGIPLNSHDLIKREFGQTPFQNPDYRANVISRFMRGMRKVDAKIRRSIELQCAQVLQTGTVTLSDENGNALYTIDFKPKSAHFPTASTTWGQVGSDEIGDLIALDEVIRNNGLQDPGIKLFGASAYEVFLQNSEVKDRINFRRADTIGIIPLTRGQGGHFRGTIDLGNYKSDIWTYGARYKHQQTGVKTQFLDPGKVVSLVPGLRLDATFGAIPNIGRELGITGPGVLPELPGRFASDASGIDLFTNVWLSPDGEQLFGGVGSRPLMIPTAIDQFGCLDTGL